ncbi:MAG: ABC transporter permease [Acidobacteriota bacterium]
MGTWLRMIAARTRGFLRPGDLERDFDDELAVHLAMAEEEKIRLGMAPDEAHRLARVELGGLTQLREAGREARGLPWLNTYWLDIKLGFRMLRKSWGLTLVGGLAMTVAISIGVVLFAVTDLFFGHGLPLDDGDRVIALQTWDVKAHRRHNTQMADFERWRDGLKSVEDIGAFQTIERNLILGGGPAAGAEGAGSVRAEPVSIAEMTASGFELARVAPLLGRPILAEDQRVDAAPVVVIGYDVWQTRFLADPAVVGQTIRLGDTAHTVVGVMPEDFAFPVNHRFWTALQAERSETLRDSGGFGVVFARLNPGATLEGAQAELATLGLLPSTTAADADKQLQARIVPYSFAFTGDFEQSEVRWMTRILLFLTALLLVPPCANIAILVYARTVTRQEEFAARYVLGASRGRIVGQLFIEMLVLAAVGAGLALALTRFGLRRLQHSVNQGLNDGAPFWIDFELTPSTVLFAAALAVVAALIAGVIPAIKATGGQMQAGLKSLGARTSVRLGGTWTALVVAQIALSLAALPSAIEMGWGTVRKGILGPGFAAEEFLTAQLMVDKETPVSAALQTELVRQLEAEPGVSAVTVATAIPGEEPWTTIEAEGVPLPEDSIFAGNNLIRTSQVDEVFFDVFRMPLLAGRTFESGDFEPARNVVIINRAFSTQLFGEGNPLGRRIRYLRGNAAEAESAPATPVTWYEIVGVVEDRPANATHGTLYQPMPPGPMQTASLALRVTYPAAGLTDRVRDITTALDPTLRIEEVLPLDEIYRQQEVGNNMGATTLLAITLSVLLLSAAGIYALMSFTVNQRRREIGIRSALGARPTRLLAGIFRRALRQLAVGATGGVLVALLFDYYLPVEMVGGWEIPGVIPAATALMVLIGLLATAGPALRGFRVEPTEALRDG